MDKFYGPDKIVDITDSGDGYKKLKLSTGKFVELSERGVAKSVTDEPLTDLNELRNKRCFYVVEKILAILLEENINIDDVDFVNKRVIMSINESCKLGNTKLWGVRDTEQTFAHVHRVLTKDMEAGAVASPYMPEETK